jgi:O-antigen/teichoic acid export membrane protein
MGSALVATFLAPSVVRVLYTGRFEPSIPVLQVLIWALVPLVMDDAALTYLYAVGCERIVQVVMLIGLAVNSGLNLWLIPRFGALGAAMATVASEGVLCVILWRQVIRHDHPV